MSIFRVPKINNYTVMANYHLRDKTLSCGAKGIMSFMLSLPDEWDYTEMGLVACLKEGRDGVRSMLKELEEHGYLVRKRVRNTDGTLGDTEYNLHEKPSNNDEPCMEKPMSVSPMLGKPMLGKPMLGRTTQISTDILNTNLTNDLIKKEKINKKEKSAFEPSPSPSFSSPAVKDTDLNSDFEKLWAMYPNKQGKSKALARFKQAIKRGVNVTDIALGIKRYNDYIRIQGIEKQFVKHGDTWFGNSCWEDELDLTPPKPKVVTPPKPILYDDPMAGGRWV